MISNKWTEEQRQGITEFGKDFLLSAAAGSGKTAVLVQRVLNLLKNQKLEISQLLIVTFTNAAASEMKERIHNALIEELGTQDSESQHLRKQIHALKNCSIGTIHSFCSDLIRRNFQYIDIDPNFRILDSDEAQLMKTEIAEEILEQEYFSHNDVFYELIEIYGSTKDDASLLELILNIYNFIHSKPDPYTWLESKTSDFNVSFADFLESEWILKWCQKIERELDNYIIDYQEALKEIELMPYFDGYAQTFQEELDNLVELRRAIQLSINDFIAALKGFQWQRLSRINKEADQDLKQKVQAIRDDVKKSFKASFDRHKQTELRQWYTDIVEIYPYLDYLRKMVFKFGQEYEKRKTEKCCLDFSDLEHKAIAVLTNEAVATDCRNRFEYIFIDEYQDSNQLQEEILKRIKRAGNLFMVGDMKQSIYRFRLADPRLFQSKYQLFKAEPQLGLCVDMNVNFRSDPRVIAGINYIFANIMKAELGGISYDQATRLAPGIDSEESNHSTLDGHLQAYLIDDIVNTENDTFDEEEEELSRIEKEARLIGNIISKQINTQIYDFKLAAMRKTRFKDIVIIMRSTKKWAAIMERELAALGIPAYSDTKGGYLESLEISIFVNLLRLLDNKQQDLPLLSVMRSGFGHFTPDELMTIRKSQDKGSFYEAARNYCQKQECELQRKLEKFFATIIKWQKDAKYLRLDDLFSKIMQESGYYYYVGALPSGESRQANLRLFMDRVCAFQDSNRPDLHNFLRYFDALAAADSDLTPARVMGENEDLVRIMSIHKSKGLEFPVVICAGLGKKFNLRDTSEPILFHQELGLGPQFRDLKTRSYRDTLARVAIKNELLSESLAEEIRLLYVACTRAQNKLILTGAVKNLRNKHKNWMPIDMPARLHNARSFLDWLGPIFLKHKDGNNLRDYFLLDTSSTIVETDNSEWIIEVVDNKVMPKAILSVGNTSPDNIFTTLDSPEVLSSLEWKYPHQFATTKPTKLSVSQLVNWFHGSKDMPLGLNIPALSKRPAFIADSSSKSKPFSPAELGIIVHLVLQNLDLRRVNSADQIMEQLDEMNRRELLTADELKSVDINMLNDFFNSPLGQRVKAANSVKREIAFNIQYDPQLIWQEEITENELFLIQGVIDLVFFEEDRVVLIDFKTDRLNVNDSKSASIISQHKMQLTLYKYALESIWNLEVSEAYIYYLQTGKAIGL